MSVTIPVYNGEWVSRGYLESMLARTYSDWDAICINDGSQDGSLVVLQAFAARDARFRVIDKQNAGVSAARKESFGNALAYIRTHFADCTKIIENNAACPLVQVPQIDAMVAVLDEYDYVQSTFKITEALGSYSSRTVDREDYFLIQAPDAYRFPLLDRCFDAGHPNGHPAVQLPAEATGYNYFVEGQPFKITYPDDLEIAEILLRRQQA